MGKVARVINKPLALTNANEMSEEIKLERWDPYLELKHDCIIIFTLKQELEEELERHGWCKESLISEIGKEPCHEPLLTYLFDSKAEFCEFIKNNATQEKSHEDY